MTSASMTAFAQRAEFGAGGTDLSERRRSGVSRGALIDLDAAPDTTGVTWGADGAATMTRKLKTHLIKEPVVRERHRPIH